MVDALYKLLPTEESQAETDTPNSSLLGLVFLIKAITKAAVLLRAKSQAVEQMFLSPVSASSDYWGSPNVLEVKAVRFCCFCFAWLPQMEVCPNLPVKVWCTYLDFVPSSSLCKMG